MKRNLFVIALTLIAMFSSLCIETTLTYAQTNQVTLKPTDDTYVDSSNPTSNYGGQNNLEIMNWQSSYSSMSDIVWLKFSLSDVPNGAVVDGATLQLYAWLVGETFNVDAYSCSDNSWTELTLTYSNMPNYNTASIDSKIVPTNSQWYNWNVADAVKNALNSNAKTVTIVLSEPSSHSSMESVWFYSKEEPVYFGEDYSPKLTIHWSANATPTPTQKPSPSPSVPEFQSWIILSVITITTFSAVIIFRRKQTKSALSYFFDFSGIVDFKHWHLKCFSKMPLEA